MIAAADWLLAVSISRLRWARWRGRGGERRETIFHYSPSEERQPSKRRSVVSARRSLLLLTNSICV